MPEPDLIQLFAEPLNQLGARYIVRGSVAAMLYGEPRLTHDIDFVIFLRVDQIPKLTEVYPAPEFYVPPESAILSEVTRERAGHFNVIHADSGLKADFFTTNRDELHAWAFRNMKKYSIRGTSISLAPPEYVILSKLEYFREGGSEKHLRDIRSRIAVSGEQLDRPALSEWVQIRGLQEQWRLLSR
jgi:hypothetical protein